MGHDHTHTHMTDAAETFALSGHAIVIACPCGHITMALPASTCTVSDAAMLIASMLDGIERTIDGLAASHGVPAEEIRGEIGGLLAVCRGSRWDGTFTRVAKPD